MFRYFIYLQYKGTEFHGWQIQPNAKTVQEELQNALTVFFQKEIEVVGAGRTDTGVHAKQMVAHFSIDEKIVNNEFIFRVNNLLSYFISIDSLSEVTSDSHARFDAIDRTYLYHIHTKKDPFLNDLSFRNTKDLDIDLMNKAAEKLIRKADFSCFSKSNTQTFTNDCEITKAGWSKSGYHLVFEITSNRFLRNMVRAIVGTLIEVGEGKRSVESIDKLIASKNRSNAGSSVPACGLYLESIRYPKKCFNI